MRLVRGNILILMYCAPGGAAPGQVVGDARARRNLIVCIGRGSHGEEGLILCKISMEGIGRSQLPFLEG